MSYHIRYPQWAVTGAFGLQARAHGSTRTRSSLCPRRRALLFMRSTPSSAAPFVLEVGDLERHILASAPRAPGREPAVPFDTSPPKSGSTSRRSHVSGRAASRPIAREIDFHELQLEFGAVPPMLTHTHRDLRADCLKDPSSVPRPVPLQGVILDSAQSEVADASRRVRCSKRKPRSWCPADSGDAQVFLGAEDDVNAVINCYASSSEFEGSAPDLSLNPQG
jgi:hypothetical protein